MNTLYHIIAHLSSAFSHIDKKIVKILDVTYVAHKKKIAEVLNSSAIFIILFARVSCTKLINQ